MSRAGWPWPLEGLLAAGPFAVLGAALLVSPGGHLLLALLMERRMPRPREEFRALAVGDPLLALAAALGTRLLTVRPVAAPPWWLPALVAGGWLLFGLWQWRDELRSGFYLPAQACSPTKIWHQLVIYPLFGTGVLVVSAAGLLTRGGGPAAVLTKAALLLLVLGWALLLRYDRRHPRLGHPPYDWRRLRPWPRPWPETSTTLRTVRRG
ncbi:hypothetical protein ACIRBX_13205 [Kitasatospora sp. NPDC096147]|uniref:hypothetical protein n=1 Tax=Kitasatospora sp. NPDC096147 TaxID=3364093 RepID=UPI003800CF40